MGHKFNIGDSVVLKSGGPCMTIGVYWCGTEYSDTKYQCKWFVNGVLHDAIFKEAELENNYVLNFPFPSLD